ncbi:MAG: ribosomal-protein-alanine N-acetyltransferase [Planctomycetota bacterium]|jgi:ribosomal-protein-alanine N-acetyltransferase
MKQGQDLELFDVRLKTKRLDLRVASVGDAEALLAFARHNREPHSAWDPRRTEAYYELPWWRDHLDLMAIEIKAGRAAPFVGFLRDGGELVLRANLSNVVRGAFQAAYLGFAVDHQQEGQGLAFEGVDAVVRFGLGDWNLHRVMANYRPNNKRSEAILGRLGFEREGLANDYLFIDGAWRDHVLTSRSSDDWVHP